MSDGVSEQGYKGTVAREITFNAQRDPMFMDEDGNGWVPLSKFVEDADEHDRRVRVLEAERDEAVAQSEEDNLVMQNCHAGCLAAEAVVAELQAALEDAEETLRGDVFLRATDALDWFSFENAVVETASRIRAALDGEEEA